MAAGIGLISYLRYISAVCRGQAQPSSTTWGIWSVHAMLTALSCWLADVGAASWIAYVSALCSVIVFVLALFKGKRENGVNWWVVALLAATVPLWLLTQNATLILLHTLGIKLIGAIPTFRKAWNEPETEDRSSWSLGVVSKIVNLFAISECTVSAISYPVFMFVLTIMLTVPLFRAQKRNQPSHQQC